MSSQGLKGLLLPWQPGLQFVRHRTRRINIQRPAPPHFLRSVVLEVCKPKFKKRFEGMSMAQTCGKVLYPKREDLKKENPYEKIIAKEVWQWFKTSRMIAFLHQNPMTADDLFKMRLMLHKHNMVYKVYNRVIYRLALTETKYECMLPVTGPYGGVIFSSEPEAVKLLRVLRRVPQVTLLAAIVDERPLSKNEFVAYGKLPDLQTMRAQVCATLQAATVQLSQSLIRHQQTLCTHLENHSKSENKNDA